MLRLALAYGFLVGALCSCNTLGGGPPRRVDWRWVERTFYEATPGRGDKVFLFVTDREQDQVLAAGLREGIARKLQQEYGFTLVSDPIEADYDCRVWVRYFNQCPPPRKTELLEDEPLADGEQGWKTQSGAFIDSPPHVPEIKPKGGSYQWELLIDLAVGERMNRGAEDSYFQLRSARLLGQISGSKEDALWWFREGHAPPAAREGVTQESLPPEAAHLTSVLSRGLFRESGAPSEAQALATTASIRGSQVEVRIPVLARCKIAPTRGNTFFLALEDFEEDPELCEGLRDRLIWKFEQQGLDYVDEPEQAKYACYVYLRYFNGIPSCAELESSAGSDVFGGRPGWKIAGGEELKQLDFQEIKPMSASNGWGILIDIAVGESTGEIGQEVDLRSGRLLACLPGANREEALWLIRAGGEPPKAEKVPEGQTPLPPHRPDPPDFLVKILSDNLLPVRVAQ